MTIKIILSCVRTVREGSFLSAPAERAELTFRNAYSPDCTFERLEFERGEFESAAYLLTHTLASLGVGVAVFCEILDTLDALEFVDYLPCDEFKL